MASKKRLFVRDRISGIRFLIDTGSDISLLPADTGSKKRPVNYVLYAANNSPINTHGERRLSLDLGLKRPVVWNFCVASMPYAIMGADLLSHYGFNVDLRNHRIINAQTGVSTIVLTSTRLWVLIRSTVLVPLTDQYRTQKFLPSFPALLVWNKVPLP